MCSRGELGFTATTKNIMSGLSKHSKCNSSFWEFQFLKGNVPRRKHCRNGRPPLFLKSRLSFGISTRRHNCCLVWHRPNFYPFLRRLRIFAITVKRGNTGVYHLQQTTRHTNVDNLWKLNRYLQRQPHQFAP